MKMNKHIAVLAIGITVACASAAAHDRTGVSQDRTHLGVTVDRMVNLRATGVCPGFESLGGLTDRILPNGTVSHFSVPPGKLFVVTDFGWSTSSSLPGSTVSVALLIVNQDDGLQLLGTEPRTVDAGGRAAAHVNLISGVVAAPGATLCASQNLPTDGLDIHVYGYLVDDMR